MHVPAFAMFTVCAVGTPHLSQAGRICPLLDPFPGMLYTAHKIPLFGNILHESVNYFFRLKFRYLQKGLKLPRVLKLDFS